MAEQFEVKEIENPRLIGEMLLTHVLGGNRIDLYANANRVATEQERTQLRALVQRAIAHEPVQFIVGNAWFFGSEFQVNPSTLIPRTCTERLVEQVIEYCASTLSEPNPRIAEIGTGSGCIAITLASNIQDATIVATDISTEALDLAQRNATEHHQDSSITFCEGDAIAPLFNLDPFDIICSNPPYIPEHEMSALAPNVADWEPKIALCGGKDGMDILSKIIRDAPKHLKPMGLLIVEISSSIRDHALEFAQAQSLLEDVKILQDSFGDDRFLRAIRKSQ
jgi:release factor glutamine methyltransferase